VNWTRYAGVFYTFSGIKISEHNCELNAIWWCKLHVSTFSKTRAAPDGTKRRRLAMEQSSLDPREEKQSQRWIVHYCELNAMWWCNLHVVITFTKVMVAV